ncbi:MAG TPA: hypothetical protein VFA34_14815, partial [Actinomycetota bacterium]|nr:hypothetical protein [Actinomycetota bacterium]
MTPRLRRACMLLAGLWLALLPAPASAAPTCWGFEATIVGTEGADKIEGTSGSDVIVGLGGAD